MKIYTKTGDTGQTGLLGGSRVSKTHLAIAAVGSLDETNCFLGVAISHSPTDAIVPHLKQIQNDLFDLGSRIAAFQSEHSKPARFTAARIAQLENWIDQYQSELPPLREFILPGGSSAGAMLHLARSVCRRCERDLVALLENNAKCELPLELTYLNRLGDLLFVWARYENQLNGSAEIKWSVTREQGRSTP